jgi:outer membrane protein assembly factor BamB
LKLVGVSDDLAFVHTADDVKGARNETLHAVSMTDGSAKSIATVSDQTATEIADGRLYYGSYHGVTAFDPDGSRAWEWLPEDDRPEVRSLSVTCGHAIVLTGSYDIEERTLHGFDAGTGERRWTVDAAGVEHLEATGGRLFAGGDRIERLDPTSGDPVWTGEGLTRGPIVEYGLAFGAADSGDGGRVEALAVPDGTTAWSRAFDIGVSLLGVTNGRVVVSPEDGEEASRLLGLDPESGETQWETTWTHEADRVFGPSVVGSERVYVVEQASEGETAIVRAVTV